MNIDNQLPEKEFEIMFLLDLIKMCSDNGFKKEANALFRVLTLLERLNSTAKTIH